MNRVIEFLGAVFVILFCAEQYYGTLGHVGMLGIERADSLARDIKIRAPCIPHAGVYHVPKTLQLKGNRRDLGSLLFHCSEQF